MSSLILEAVRKSAGLSHVQLAQRANTYQSNISMIESGVTDPGISTIEQCLSPLGFTLIAIPTTKSSVAETAIRIGEMVKENKLARAFRFIIQVSDNLQSVEPEICVALCAAPAPKTGSAKHDALLAGVVEHVLSTRRLPVPQWIHEESRRLASGWVVDTHEKDAKSIAQRTPSALLHHNVFIDKREFQSV